MRVIGGKLKRSGLYGPPPGDNSIRATYDRVRENVFNLTGPLEGLTFLDLFAGTGSVGIEALSRGAARAVFVDNAAAAVGLINRNLEKLGLTDAAEIVRADVLKYLRRPARGGGFDIIFIDPPYDSDLFDRTMRLLETANVLTGSTTVVGQHGRKPERSDYSLLECTDVRRYGITWISIWRQSGKEEE